MNVRFFAGTRAQYDALPIPRNPLGLYFCEDTNELFWADRLLTDGMRVVATVTDLPTPDKAADGVVYYITETRNGYVVPHGTTEWVQTIYAPVTDAYEVPESEIYNTVTTVGAVRDIEEKIYETIDERIANIEIGVVAPGVRTISIAGIEFTEIDGVITLGRAALREALGFILPDGLEESEIEVATKDYVDSQIANIPETDLSNYYNKSEVDVLIPKVPTKISELDNDVGYATKTVFSHEVQSLSATYFTNDFTDYLNCATDKSIVIKCGNATYSSVRVLSQAQDIYVLSFFRDNNELVKITLTVNDDYGTANTFKWECKPDIIYKIASEQFVKDSIDALEIPEADLSNYYNKSETETLVNEAVNRIEIPDTSGFITIGDVEGKGYLTSDDIANKADINHNHDDLYETKGAAEAVKNDLLNGAGDAYNTLKELGEAIDANKDVIESLREIAAGKADAEHDHSQYLTELPTHTHDEYLTELPEHTHDEYLTELPDHSHDEYLTEMPEHTHSEYLTELPEHEHEQYLTEHQDISGKADKVHEHTEYANKTHNHSMADITDYVVPEIPSLDGYATRDYVRATTVTQKYEVLPFEGALINYTDNEVRVNTEHVDINNLPVQTPGDGNSGAYYYMTFKAYAPAGATHVIEGQNDQMEVEPSSLSVDGYGRKYTTIWAAIANKVGDTWSKFGDKSTVDKYLGFYYNFHWYDDDKLIAMDKVRVILTNDACHNDLVPDAIARRIDDKINAIEVPEVNLENYYTKSEVEEEIVTELTKKADNIVFTTDNFVKNPMGNFKLGDNVNGLTVAELFAKLLGLSDVVEEPELPEESGIINQIIRGSIPMYQLKSDGELEVLSYDEVIKISAEEDALQEQPKPTQSGFYEIEGIEGDIVEYGYQHVQVKVPYVPYMIALPDFIDYQNQVTVEMYREMDSTWQVTNLSLTSDADEIADICDLEGCEIPEAPEGYTLWVSNAEIMSSNTVYRFIITETEA